MKTIRLLALFAIASIALVAQNTRPVVLTWNVVQGASGYSLSVGSSAAGPFSVIACFGTVPGSTCVAGSTASTTTYTDNQAVGGTAFYQIVAVSAPCTPTTPVTSPCGTAAPTAASTTVPPRPAAVTITTVTVP